MVRVAAVQATPVFLDREATTDKACALIKEAAAGGARLVAFPESFIPTYPDWVWRTVSWADTRYVRLLYENSVEVPGPIVDRLGEAARHVAVLVPGHGAVAEGPEVAARLAADHAYIDALRRGEEPVDARLGPDATWLADIHQSNLEQARGR